MLDNDNKASLHRITIFEGTISVEYQPVTRAAKSTKEVFSACLETKTPMEATSMGGQGNGDQSGHVGAAQPAGGVLELGNLPKRVQRRIGE